MTDTNNLGQSPKDPNNNPIPNSPVYPSYPVSHEPAAPELQNDIAKAIPTAQVNPVMQSQAISNPITSPLNTVTEPIPYDPSKAQTNNIINQTGNTITFEEPKKTKGKMNVFGALLLVIFIIALIVVLAIVYINGTKTSNLNLTSTPTPSITPTMVITDNTNTDNVAITGVLLNPMITELKNDFRIKITSPLAYQVVNKTGTTITIKGEMKGFFEGVMNFRIVDERYYEIANGTINAQGDNLTDFAPFEKQFTIPNFADSTEIRGMIEFSETNMKDGTASVIASLPLVFR